MLLQDCQIADAGTLKQKTHLQAHLLQVPKMQQWLFWEILAFCCFSQ
jgi:hypothetical protein